MDGAWDRSFRLNFKALTDRYLNWMDGWIDGRPDGNRQADG